jgi:hypothetical protein
MEEIPEDESVAGTMARHRDTKLEELPGTRNISLNEDLQLAAVICAAEICGMKRYHLIVGKLDEVPRHFYGSGQPADDGSSGELGQDLADLNWSLQVHSIAND